MYAKIFSIIMDSSIAEDYQCRHLFMDLLVLANQDGEVDMTAEAVSRRTNVPIEIVKQSIEKLMQPDPNSRNREQDGRRIVPLSEDRTWGWRIVSYAHYREIRDSEQLRQNNRVRKQRQRSFEFDDDEMVTVSCDSSVTGSDLNVTACDQAGRYASASEYASTSVTPGLKEKGCGEKPMRDAAEDVYQAYPKHVNRQESLKAITKAIRDVGYDKVLAATRTFAKLWEGDEEMQYCPFPSTWFNRGAYKDPPECFQRPNGKHAGNGSSKPTTQPSEGQAKYLAKAELDRVEERLRQIDANASYTSQGVIYSASEKKESNALNARREELKKILGYKA